MLKCYHCKSRITEGEKEKCREYGKVLCKKCRNVYAVCFLLYLTFCLVEKEF